MNPEPTDLNDLAALARTTKSTRYRRALASATAEIERLRDIEGGYGFRARCREAAYEDEIERLRNDLDGSMLAYRGASYDRDRMRTERDEARQSVCKMSIHIGGVFRRVGGKTVEVTTPEGCAEIMGWDCFKENTE